MNLFNKPGNTLLNAFMEDYARHSSVLVFLVPAMLLPLWLDFHAPRFGTLLWFLAGWAVFIPQEYLTHRFILHYPPPRNPWLYRQLYRLHYGHHDLPQRSDLMYMPLWLILPMLAGNLVLLNAITPGTNALLAALEGLFCGYLLFEWTHLFCHLPHVPKTRLGQLIKKRHTLHHFRDEQAWFSVSAPVLFMDYLAGTAPEQIKTSGTSRHFGLEADDPRLLESRAYFADWTSGDLTCSRIWLEYMKTREANI
jgi:hypothetical protein